MHKIVEALRALVVMDDADGMGVTGWAEKFDAARAALAEHDAAQACNSRAPVEKTLQVEQKKLQDKTRFFLLLPTEQLSVPVLKRRTRIFLDNGTEIIGACSVYGSNGRMMIEFDRAQFTVVDAPPITAAAPPDPRL